MKKILIPFTILWRVWFYVTVGIAIIILLPFLIVFSIRERSYPQFFLCARIWAWIVLILSGFIPVIRRRNRIVKGQNYIICANHTSMIDIMMTYVTVPNLFLFIGKKELTKLPLFGYFYKKTNILVDRSSLSSKRDVFHQAREKLRQGMSVCIYPEGGVPRAHIELAPFKAGAFRLAAEENIPVLPLTFPDNKKHFSYNFLSGGPGILRAIVHEPISAEKVGEELLKRRTYSIIYRFLRIRRRQRLQRKRRVG